MSSLVLVDSNYWIRMIALRREPFEELAAYTGDYDFAINGIIWIEVVRGRSDPNKRARFDEGFSTMPVLELSAAGWQRAAALAWQMDRLGRVIPLTDLAIAATAMEHDAAVLTFDRHFQHIPGLVVVNDLP
ncbi:MAG: PIN domain-containing protein [Opitutaceae bacterium]|nr:PIN domain-containing protein [Opitutaceae bacterium]